MNLQDPSKPHSAIKRLMNKRECFVPRMDSLNASGLIIGGLNEGIGNPRTTIADIATILRRDGMWSARIIRIANSSFFSAHLQRVQNHRGYTAACRHTRHSSLTKPVQYSANRLYALGIKFIQLLETSRGALKPS